MKILRFIKRKIYFVVAAYFAFWARIFLARWKPTIITVTGSSGKTTLLHLFESQLDDAALFSHHANSAFGIPFHILGLERKNFKIYEWFLFAFLAPFQSWRTIPEEKIYVTEADAERPGEGQFLARLLKPHAVVWLSLEEAHGVNFDAVAHKSKDIRDGVKKAMAHEFGYFLEYAQQYVVLNQDNTYINEESYRTSVEKILISAPNVTGFNVQEDSVTIDSVFGKYHIPQLIPPQAALSVVAVMMLLKKMDIQTDNEFKLLTLPPGRSSVFKGKKDTVIIDSSYNATYDGVRTMLDLMKHYPARSEKWLVLGDMIEQGKSEADEHRDLAQLIIDTHPTRVIMVGPRLQKHTYPLLQQSMKSEFLASFLMPADAHQYLEKELKGGETLLFKGARYLEGIVERLLDNPNDADNLCRREEVWVEKRKKWGI